MDQESDSSHWILEKSAQSERLYPLVSGLESARTTLLEQLQTQVNDSHNIDDAEIFAIGLGLTGDYFNAVKVLRDIINHTPGRASAYLNLAVAFHAMEMVELELEILEECASKCSDDERHADILAARIATARLRASNEDWDKRFQVSKYRSMRERIANESATVDDLVNYGGLVILLLSYRAVDIDIDVVNAIDALTAAHELAPSRLDILTALARAHVINHGRDGRSAEILLKLERLDPHSRELRALRELPKEHQEEAFQNRNLTLMQLAISTNDGGSTAARDEIFRLARMFPENPNYSSALMILHMATGDIEASVSIADRLVLAHPTDHNVHYNAMQVYRKQNDGEKASHHLAEGIRHARSEQDVADIVNLANELGIETPDDSAE